MCGCDIAGQGREARRKDGRSSGDAQNTCQELNDKNETIDAALILSRGIIMMNTHLLTIPYISFVYNCIRRCAVKASIDVDVAHDANA